jgi:nucleoside-diphosphate-sugar epimerase
MHETILILGAGGQLGTELVEILNQKYGHEHVIICDLKPLTTLNISYQLDVLDELMLNEIMQKHAPTQVYHLAAVLSAKGESIPLKAWNINMQGWLNVLESCKKHQTKKIFYPSSIAVFGHTTPKLEVPQHTINEPNTVYGISKYAGELWANYYHEKYTMDIRGIRFPGIISYKVQAGGGTTDYAVDIFHHAIANREFVCFLSEHTALPMVYMPDALDAIVQLMDAPASKLKIRTSYNIHSMTLTPAILYNELLKYNPDFKIIYQPDSRQQIADSWCQSLDDTCARNDWHWQPNFDLSNMVEDIWVNLTKKE